jgi:hypothetical protein
MSDCAGEEALGKERRGGKMVAKLSRFGGIMKQ